MQGNRSMVEYDWDVSHIVGLIPFVVRDEYHKVRMFVKGLKPNIKILIMLHGVMIFNKCLDRAQMIQNDMEEARIERYMSEKNGNEKCPFSKSSGGSLQYKITKAI